MQIKISHRHGAASPEMDQFIEEKATKLLHAFDRITMIEITVDLHHPERKFVEVRVDAEHKHDFVSSDTDADWMTAVERAMDRVKAQLHRYKEKIQDHRRDPSHNELRQGG